jgi:hypothetical protein
MAIKKLRLTEYVSIIINELGKWIFEQINKRHASKEPNRNSNAIQLRSLGCVERIPS